jgi:PKD domain-containing protein
MSLTVRTPRKLIATLFILVFAVSFLVPMEPPSSAQVSGCPGNIVVNGNFTNGLASWTGYGTPDLGTTMGYQDPGFVGMWGNQNPNIGEGLQQALTTTINKTYVGSIGFKRLNDPNKLPYAMLRVRCLNNAATGWNSTGTIFLSPSITTTSWTPFSFTFTATSSVTYLVFDVESNSSANDGTQTSYGYIDNVCIREAPLDFTAATVCHGQPTQFTSNANATSWAWDFGDTFHGTGPTPNHTYAHAGTYNVTLCINGTTTCVTKTVTIPPGPAPPVITGPTSACGPATYSVQAVLGFAYAWTITNGTINGSSTGNIVNVIWNSTGVGTITVVASTHGCTSEPATLTVHTCNINAGDCCMQFQTKTDLAVFTDAGNGNGVYNVTPNLSANLSNIIQVTADIVSSSLSYFPTTCGTSGPANGYVVGATNVTSPVFTASVTVPNGHEVIWNGYASNVSGVNFPMQIKFPPPPTNVHCRDFLTFCIKYTFTNNQCKSCEVIRCYGPYRRDGGALNPVEDNKNNTQ